MLVTAFYLYVAATSLLPVTLPLIVGTVLIDISYLSLIRLAIKARYDLHETDDEDDAELVDDEWDDPV
jgi:hypothetical protein